MAGGVKIDPVKAQTISDLAADLAELGEITAGYEAERQETIQRYTAKLDAIAAGVNRASDVWADRMDKRWSNWREVIAATIPLKGGGDNDRPDA